jgi:hypothetical protein
MYHTNGEENDDDAGTLDAKQRLAGRVLLLLLQLLTLSC